MSAIPPTGGPSFPEYRPLGDAPPSPWSSIPANLQAYLAHYPLFNPPDPNSAGFQYLNGAIPMMWDFYANSITPNPNSTTALHGAAYNLAIDWQSYAKGGTGAANAQKVEADLQNLFTTASNIPGIEVGPVVNTAFYAGQQLYSEIMANPPAAAQTIQAAMSVYMTMVNDLPEFASYHPVDVQALNAINEGSLTNWLNNGASTNPNDPYLQALRSDITNYANTSWR